MRSVLPLVNSAAVVGLVERLATHGCRVAGLCLYFPCVYVPKSRFSSAASGQSQTPVLAGCAIYPGVPVV